MTARFFISSHRNCRRFLAATHHAAILNNYARDLQVLHFTLERGIKNINQFQHLDKFKYLHLGIPASIDYRGSYPKFSIFDKHDIVSY